MLSYEVYKGFDNIVAHQHGYSQNDFWYTNKLNVTKGILTTQYCLIY